MDHPPDDAGSDTTRALHARAAVHAALGDPVRLAVVEELSRSDRSPGELARLLDHHTNLVAFHLDVLERVGLIERFTSTGDRRRRYVRLVPTAFPAQLVAARPEAGAADRSVLFVCTHNSARSQLAEALWRDRVGSPVASAGTHPAASVHPGAIAAARRAGLDLSTATPQRLSQAASTDLVITVCDRAHEELTTDPAWLHWSIPDPVEAGDAAAFDAVVEHLDDRIVALATTAGARR